MKSILPILVFLCVQLVTAQTLPTEMYYSSDGHTLYSGGHAPEALYEKNIIREVHLDFPQANYWTLLTNNYASETEIPATMTFDGEVFDSVGVRFRGNTSYFMIGNSQKKSFAVTIDFVHDNQSYKGFKNLKFNNAHEDATFMREVLYCQMAARHTPIAKANFIHLFLNNQDWGIYPNIESIDKTYLKGYFLSSDGARFRATNEEAGPGGGGGPGWGDGTAGMNYLGLDTTTYQKYYGLKPTEMENPWQKLIDVCQVLSTATASNMDEVRTKLDIDKALWFLAVENVFTDDDSYIMKGKMDYYVYYEPETGRSFPLEYDGNSTFQTGANTVNWSPFKNATNANYPLLSKLLSIPSLRQRYLAHYRTILNETFTVENATAIIDSTDAMIRSLVNADPKKLYPFAQYTSGVAAMKTFVSTRRNFLLTNAEIAQVAPTITSAPFYNAQQAEYAAPKSGEEAYVKAMVTSTNGISAVNLYYTTGMVGNFEVTSMYDDGLHEDGASGDGLYAGTIPAYAAGTFVRYYVEAVGGNAALSASYLPTGAEHDVFVYTVQQTEAITGVVINELLASNTAGVIDEAGEHDDWIELYNTNNFNVDLSGYYMSDDNTIPDQWQIPAGTVIGAHDYLIIWADEDGEQGPLHSNFKLSTGGESLLLYDPFLVVLDQVTFGQQISDKGYARVPNGTGPFVIQAATFHASNDLTPVTTGVVINEILASNTIGETDEAGDYEDWVELYNTNAFDVDLSGFYFSDNVAALDKWQLPAGTILPADGYLIVWADDEMEEGPMHAAWKLSSVGEMVALADTLLQVIDSITFGAQTADVAFARVPNGSGGFIPQAPTFNSNNDVVSGTTNAFSSDLTVFPNPCSDLLQINGGAERMRYELMDAQGQVLRSGVWSGQPETMSIGSLPSGMYYLRVGKEAFRTIKLIKL